MASTDPQTEEFKKDWAEIVDIKPETKKVNTRLGWILSLSLLILTFTFFQIDYKDFQPRGMFKGAPSGMMYGQEDPSTSVIAGDVNGVSPSPNPSPNPPCGNGLIDSGEECDPLLTIACDSGGFPDRPHCNAAGSEDECMCGPCETNNECDSSTNGQKPRCKQVEDGDNTCVECEDMYDCPAYKPYCVDNKCDLIGSLDPKPNPSPSPIPERGCCVIRHTRFPRPTASCFDTNYVECEEVFSNRPVPAPIDLHWWVPGVTCDHPTMQTPSNCLAPGPYESPVYA